MKVIRRGLKHYDVEWRDEFPWTKCPECDKEIYASGDDAWFKTTGTRSQLQVTCDTCLCRFVLEEE